MRDNAHSKKQDILKRITVNPDICHGKPCIRGLRYPVESILDLLSSGMTSEEVLAEHQDLERDDILAVLTFGARQTSMGVLIQRIVDIVHPLRIVLFGSMARNEPSADGDVDLLVVMPDGTHRRQTAQQIYSKVRRVGVPFDVVVATPEDLDRHKSNPGLVYARALREGREVYAA